MSKPKPIDLGVLQEAFEQARKELSATSKALSKAQDAYDTAKGKYERAQADLKSGARTVLG